MSMEIVVIGLNHSTAPVDIREKVTFPGDEDGKVTRTLSDLQGVEEAVILSTCKRAEVVAFTVDAEESAQRLVKAIGAIHGLDPAAFRPFLYVKTQREAVRHLFRYHELEFAFPTEIFLAGLHGAIARWDGHGAKLDAVIALLTYFLS